MQSAYWLVSGSYQTYQNNGTEVEINLDVERLFDLRPVNRHSDLNYRGAPGGTLFRQVKNAIDTELEQSKNAIMISKFAEVNAQLGIGEELARLSPGSMAGNIYFENLPSADVARIVRSTGEAMHVLETVLLLDPSNREARLVLAACILQAFPDRIEEARNYFREVIEAPPQDRLSSRAQLNLDLMFNREDAETKARWFQKAASQYHGTNVAIKEFYQVRADAAHMALEIAGPDKTKVRGLAEKQIFEAAKQYIAWLKQPTNIFDGPKLKVFVETFGTDKAAGEKALADLYPKLKVEYPEWAPIFMNWFIPDQLDTNAPIIQEFFDTMRDCLTHTNRVLRPDMLSEEIDLVYRKAYFQTNADLAARVIALRYPEANGFGQYSEADKLNVAEANAAAGRWKVALEVVVTCTNECDQILSNTWNPYGRPILPRNWANFCRRKLGMPVLLGLQEFEMDPGWARAWASGPFIVGPDGLWCGGCDRIMHLDLDLHTNLVRQLPTECETPLTCLLATETNVWLGTAGAGLIEFDQRDRESRPLREGDGLMMNYITSLCLAGDTLWIGYGNQGLDKPRAGGVGKLDLATRQLKSFNTSMNDYAARGGGAPPLIASTGSPPRTWVRSLTAIPGGDMLFLQLTTYSVLGEYEMKRYRPSDDTWETLPGAPSNVGCLATSDAVLAAGRMVSLTHTNMRIHFEIRGDPTARWVQDRSRSTPLVTTQELARVIAENPTNQHFRISIAPEQSTTFIPAVWISEYREGRAQTPVQIEGFYSGPTTLALDGDTVWAGGGGFVSAASIARGKILKSCHVSATAVDRIQVSGGYAWVQYNNLIHRIPLSVLE